MKTIKLLASIVAVCTFVATASAQINTTAPTNTLGTTLLYTLSLRNPAIQQTNTFSFEIGEGVRTETDSTLQATTLRGLYLVSPKVQIGLRAELDTLGEADTVAGVSFELESRYLSDNLFAAAIVGYHRDIDRDTRNLEFGIGLGAFITENFSVNTELLMQHTQDADNELQRAVVITANYRF